MTDPRRPPGGETSEDGGRTGADRDPAPPAAGSPGGAALGALTGWLSRLTAVGPGGVVIRQNLGWLLADRGVRLMLSLFVNVWLFRYLGADRLGLMSFAQSLVVLFGALYTLGLENIVVRDLVRRPDDARGVLGTAFGLRLAASLATLALAPLAVHLMRPHDREALVLTLLFTTIAFAQSFDVIEYWFQSRSRIRPLATARMIASLGGAALKMAAILSHAPLSVVGAVVACEFALSTAALVVAYRMQGDAVAGWRFRRAEARSLLADSWPLIVNGMAILISVRVDQMLITTRVGTVENGLYAAAQRLTEVIYYIPMAVMAAANPALLRLQREDPTGYPPRLERVFRSLAAAAIGIALVVSLGSRWIVALLFGPEFAGSAAVLAILAWAAPPLFLGVAQTNWFIAHDRPRDLMIRSLVAAGVSLILNLVLVPILGARGAALSMVLSQTIGHLLLNQLFHDTRPLLRMQLRALVLFWRR